MAIRFGILATYTPTQCGIATFTEALALHLQSLGAEVGVVRMVDDPLPQQAPVVLQWQTTRSGDAASVADVLNAYDIAVGTLTRLTSEADNLRPEWSPDGRRIVFLSNRSGEVAAWWSGADGSTPLQ